MTQVERRRQVLVHWAAECRSRGIAVPSDVDLGRVAFHRGIPGGAVAPLLARWRPVLMDLMWLADTGHRDPVGQVRQRTLALAAGPGGGPARPHPVPGGPPRPGFPAPGQHHGPMPGPTGPARPGPQPGPAMGAPQRPAIPGPMPQPSAGPPARPPQLQVPPPRPAQGPPPGSAQSAPGWQYVGGHPSSGTSASGPPPGAVMPSGGAMIMPSQNPPHAPQAPPQPTGADDDLLTRLRSWRDAADADEVKDRHLRLVVSNDSRTVDEVAALLPASARSCATGIVEVVGDYYASREVSSPAETNTPTPDPAAAPESELADGEIHVTWAEPAALATLVDDFAAVDFSVETNPDPQVIRSSTQGDELLLRWPAWTPPDDLDEAEFVVYRLVSSDEMTPYSPDAAQTVAVSTRLGTTDGRPPTSPVRRYQVWVNSGHTQLDAWANQPRLHAATAVVSKPTAVDIREDEGRVIGQWGVAPGVRGVRVFRVPAEQAHGGTGDPQFRILANETNLGGFVDDGAEPGRHYVYQLLVEAEIDGALQLSLPTVVPLTTRAVLEPVTDLQSSLEEVGDEARFNLRWTPPPIGRVVIYRSTHGPLPGADAETVAAEALTQMRLPDDARLAHPITLAGDGSATMVDVPWPRDWVRTYFTPVTLHGDQARVGKTIPQVRTRAVRDAKIYERVTQQVLTMPWPDGAATVQVFMSPPGEPVDLAIAGTPFAEISAAAYQRFGGLHFTQVLDATGCDLHLVPLSFAAGEKIVGRPTTVRYPGLMRLYYGCEQLPNGLLMIRVRGEFDNPTSPPFVLVHNPTRLPLDVNDGTTVHVRSEVSGPSGPLMARFAPHGLSAQWSAGWVADVHSLGSGYLRVFADVHVEDLKSVALLDPPLEYLTVGGMR